MNNEDDYLIFSRIEFILLKLLEEEPEYLEQLKNTDFETAATKHGYLNQLLSGVSLH